MAKGKPWTVEDERQLRQLLTEKKSMRSIAKVLGKTLTSVQMKASRLGLVVVDGSEKNTPSTTTFDKLVLPIESCRRRSSAQFCVLNGATLVLKKIIEWTWSPNIMVPHTSLLLLSKMWMMTANRNSNRRRVLL